MPLKEFPEYTIEKPVPIEKAIDDLRRPIVKVIRKILKLLQPIAGPKHTDIWWLGEIAVRILGKQSFDTKLICGSWISLALPVYTSHFIHGGDLKRFGKDNIHPIMRRKAKIGTVAVDIGASCGQEVVTLSKAVGEEGIVYCFEPSYSFHALLRTVSLNRLKNVVCVQAAVGKKSGYMNAQADQFYLIGNESQYVDDGGIPVLALDKFFESIHETRPVSLIKIDTDGFELEVMRGCENIFNQNPEIEIIAEFETQFDYSGFRGKELLKEYKRMGFSISKIQTSTEAVDEDDFDKYIEKMRDPLEMISHDIVLRRSLDNKNT